ncbi:hypothetical protein RB195_023288 [Necator americanus]|uniref:Uncharacterized protein n=1 Tax=Necator americanus TaxID=51031 RepID=A0ABR1EIJ0_NECAM
MQADVSLRPSAIRPLIMYGSKTWAALSAVMKRLECTESELLRRLVGYSWPRVCTMDGAVGGDGKARQHGVKAVMY